MSGKRQPNALDPVIEFAQQLGVSRTPLREAVLRLADAGMVSIECNRGIRISDSNVTDIRSVFELRLLLEVPAARATERRAGAATDDALNECLTGMQSCAVTGGDEGGLSREHRKFHDTIIATLRNDRMEGILARLRDGIRARSRSAPRGRSAVAEEHRPILDAIVARDELNAAIAMRTDLLVLGELLMRQVASVTGEAVPIDWATGFIELVGP